MKIFLSFFSLALFFTNLHSQNCEEIEELVDLISENHFSKPTLDSSKAIQSIENALYLMDPYGFFFYQEDYDSLARFKGSFFQKNDFCEFLELFGSIFFKRFNNKKEFFENLDYDLLNQYEHDFFSFKSRGSYIKNKTEGERYWGKWFKYQFNKSQLQLLEEDQKTIENHFQTKINCFFENFEIDESYKSNFFTNITFNAILQTCDPHSNYFNSGSKAVFENSLSKDILSFGFTVGKNEFDELFIDDITPGSSVYFNSNINKGDILLSIEWTNEEIDYLPCASDEDVNFSLSTTEANNIKISIKNELGIVSDVIVTKEKIQNDENFLAAFVLEGEKKSGLCGFTKFLLQQ